MRHDRVIPTLLLAACLTPVGCHCDAASRVIPNCHAPFPSRGTSLADAGHRVYQYELPTFRQEVPKLIERHAQAQSGGGFREEESLDGCDVLTGPSSFPADQWFAETNCNRSIFALTGSREYCFF